MDESDLKRMKEAVDQMCATMTAISDYVSSLFETWPDLDDVIDQLERIDRHTVKR